MRDQRFLLAGSGAAGVGIGRLLRTALMAEGLTEAEARRSQVFVDSGGLVCQSRQDLEFHKREVALQPGDLAALGLTDPPPAELESLIAAVRPTVLIGTTGKPGGFTPQVIRTMAEHNGVTTSETGPTCGAGFRDADGAVKSTTLISGRRDLLPSRAAKAKILDPQSVSIDLTKGDALHKLWNFHRLLEEC